MKNEPQNKVVYVGPTILGVSARNTIYTAVPDTIKKAAEKAPYLLSLCIPISELSDAMRQIQTKSGGYYTFYQKALEYTP